MNRLSTLELPSPVNDDDPEAPDTAMLSACSVADLTFSEQLVVWAMRRWLHERVEAGEQPGLSLSHCIEEPLVTACGLEQGERAAVGIAAFMTLLCASSRQARRLHRLECTGVSVDECLFLSIIAALQAGDRFLAQGRLVWLMPAPVAAIAERNLQMAADALTAGDRHLPQRLGGHA
jgi:hypothetical protein